MSALRIVRATMADRALMFKYMRKNYFQQDPLYISLNQAFHRDVDETIKYSLEGLEHGYSFLAFQDRKLVGLAVNRVGTRDELDIKTKLAEQCTNEEMTKVLRFYRHVEEKADFWQRFDVKQVLMVEATSVQPDMAKLGIGRALTVATIELGNKAGLGLRGDSSSHYSAMMVKKLGLNKVFAVKYADYIGVDGHPVFPVQPPHTEFGVWYKPCSQ